MDKQSIEQQLETRAPLDVIRDALDLIGDDEMVQDTRVEYKDSATYWALHIAGWRVVSYDTLPRPAVRINPNTGEARHAPELPPVLNQVVHMAKDVPWRTIKEKMKAIIAAVDQRRAEELLSVPPGMTVKEAEAQADARRGVLSQLGIGQ